MTNNNLNYLDDRYGHMNANNLLQLKNELESLELKDIYKEVILNNPKFKSRISVIKGVYNHD